MMKTHTTPLPAAFFSGFRGVRRPALLALLLLPLPVLPVAAAEPQHWYWWLRAQVQFVEESAEAPAEAEAARPGDLAHQVGLLREDVDALTVTVELYLGSLLANLQEENARLRAEVQRLQAVRGAAEEGNYFVPSPYDRLPRSPDMLPDGVPSPVDLAQRAPGPPGSTGAAAYEVIDAWGRAPEDVAESGQEASTLKGMIVLVDAAMDRAGLEVLGRQLYEEFAVYDNINIEFYTDRATAQAAAEGRPGDPRHRVLIVSKHAASNRKLMIYLGGAAPETTLLD